MTWSDVTVFQYQQINDLYANAKDMTDLDLSVKVASILKNLTEHQIDSLPVKELGPLLESISFIHTEIQPQAVDFVKVNGRVYKCIYDVRNIPAARYIESKHFSSDVMGNLHKIFACMVIPQKKTWFGWKDDKYDASKHSDYAQDILEAPIVNVLGSVVFFLSSLQTLDKEFKGLFGPTDDGGEDEQGGGREGMGGFMQHYGWIYQTKLVADFEGITLNQAFDLPTINFLNDLAYLKAKMEHDNELIKKQYGKG